MARKKEIIDVKEGKMSKEMGVGEGGGWGGEGGGEGEKSG